MPPGLRAGTAFVELEPRLAQGFEQRVAADLERPLSRVGDRLSSTGATLSRRVTLPLVAGIAAAGAGVVAAGMQIDDALDSIAIRSGATGERLESLEGSFRTVAARVPDSISRVSDAVGLLAQRTDLTGAPLESMAERILTLSRITGQDLETTITNSTRLFADWSIATGDQADTLDELYRATTATGIPLDRLQGLLVTFGGPLRQLGFGLEESAAMLGNFEREGVNTELVVGAMRQSLGRMARAGEEPIETFRRVTEEIKNAGSAGEANGIALELFGARAGPDMAAAIREGRFEIGGLWDEVARGEGTIMGAAAETDGFAETFGRLRNRVILAVEPIATRLFAALDEFVPRLTPVIDTIGRVIEWLLALDPKWQLLIAGVIAAVAAAGPLVTVIGGIATVLGVVLSPVGLVVAAVAALAAGLVYAYRNSETFRNVVDGVVSWIRDNVVPVVVAVVAGVVDAFSALVGWVRENWPAISEAIGHVLAVVTDIITAAVAVIRELWSRFGDDLLARVAIVWDAIRLVVETAIGVVRQTIALVLALINGDWGAAWDALKGLLGVVWDGIVGAVRVAIDLVRNTLALGLDAVRGVWDLAWAGISGVLGGIWDGIVGVVSGAAGRVRDTISTVLGGVRAVWDGIWNPIRDTFVGVWTAIETAFNRVIGVIRGAWNGLAGFWNSHNSITFEGYDIPGPGPNIPGFSVSLPDLPTLATGGIFTAGEGLAVLHGPEAVLPLDDPLAMRFVTGALSAALLPLERRLGGDELSSSGDRGPAVLVEEANFYDETDLDSFFRRASFAALEGSFG